MKCKDCGEKLLNMYQNDNKWKFCPNKFCERFLQSTEEYLIYNPT